jgi:hypothetical protein
LASRITPSKGSKPDKLWRDAIAVAVHRAINEQEKKNNLAALAEKLVEKGLSGDVMALKEIGDRLDGKASQDINAKLAGAVTVNGKVEFV